MSGMGYCQEGWKGFGKTGADKRSRTSDLRITNALLYQLSYIGPERDVIASANHGVEG